MRGWVGGGRGGARSGVPLPASRSCGATPFAPADKIQADAAEALGLAVQRFF